VSDLPAQGRSLVTRRAITDVVRAAVCGSYGVTGLSGGDPIDRVLAALGLREPGIRVRLDRGIAIDIHMTVGYGVPVAEVARQVDSAVRYALRRAFDREPRRLTIHVGGLRLEPASQPPPREPARTAPSALPATRTRPDPTSSADEVDGARAADPADAA
jgi:uncharacterized alkaline shock family protein YloU